MLESPEVIESSVLRSWKVRKAWEAMLCLIGKDWCEWVVGMEWLELLKCLEKLGKLAKLGKVSKVGKLVRNNWTTYKLGQPKNG